MAGIKTGQEQAKQNDPVHVPGTKMGNSKGNYEKQSGHTPDGRNTSERSTGIDASARNPIDPSMPNLPPA